MLTIDQEMKLPIFKSIVIAAWRMNQLRGMKALMGYECHYID